MFYLVISTPHASKSDEVKEARLHFRSWISALKTEDKIISFYPRVGRGSIVIFDIASNDELHILLNQWTAIVPVSFEIYPLATPATAEALLK